MDAKLEKVPIFIRKQAILNNTTKVTDSTINKITQTLRSARLLKVTERQQRLLHSKQTL